MAFTDREISNEDGSPIALYEMKWGNTIWRYTSADERINFNIDGEPGEMWWESVAITDSGMVQGGSSTNEMIVSGPSNLPIYDLFRGTPPAGSISLIVRRIHLPEAEAPIYWIGSVANVKGVAGGAQIDIIGKTLGSSLRRTGLRLCWTRGCPHFLFNSSCGLDMDDWDIDSEIVSMTGNTITVQAHGQEEGYFDGGFFRWTANADGTYDQRGIEEEIAPNVFRLLGGTDRLEVGMNIKLYPGCDLSPGTCNDKFDNMDNHGGWEFMTNKSPFDGTPVF